MNHLNQWFWRPHTLLYTISQSSCIGLRLRGPWRVRVSRLGIYYTSFFQPKGLRRRMCPGSEGIAAEAVDSHNTKGRLRLAKATEQGETTVSGP
jgi:hypothetical protein